MFDRIRGAPQVTSSVIAEAVIIYLIIAIAFSQIYWFLNALVPHSFNETIVTSDNTSLLYFSVVTMTAVGYGGIRPMNPYVRLVAVFESITGVFYIAVIVARLVASYRPASKSSEREPGDRAPKRLNLTHSVSPNRPSAASLEVHRNDMAYGYRATAPNRQSSSAPSPGCRRK
jgi:hypothetical protein